MRGQPDRDNELKRPSRERRLKAYSRILMSALAGWTVLITTELILLFGALRVVAFVIGPELLPSLKVVLDMGALTLCGWVAGRLGRPRTMAAAALTAAGLTLFDLTPYVPLNVPWLLRLAANAMADSRYLSSWLTTLTMHALMFGSLFFGAHLSRPRRVPVGLGFRN